MWVISVKKLRQFWQDRHNPDAESPLRAWYQTVKASDWTRFADVRNTYATADAVGNKVVFDIGGNKYRLIAVIDYEHHKLFVRYVLDHKDYDKGQWKKDTLGTDWKLPSSRNVDRPEAKKDPGAGASRRKSSRRPRRPKKR